ncbi:MULTISPECIES: glycoside hydrolase family 3 N-terminal domain-containing protein [Lactobacillus]|uniref:beta-N-acetylhexosaminidase n=1 Tax=Lactobacillus xujianguonis TaxID=2495899 RepID=A0A437SUH9_9LACO|nr:MULTISPECIES: glycoside hydrolase family 3 N-terminal domain-containing protein [Lactobacillus]RVU70467.1 beta-N-acetylhexosaminidase [Lactobacillus xujianguonis]RVU76863.1 beta-N-acetylhexosaminidase [Lactobacillus xujianguonis]
MHRFRKIALALVAGATLASCFSLTVRAKTSKQVSNSQINQYLKHASLNDKIGQMFIARTPQNLGQAEKDAVKYNLGGYIVYDADLADLTQKQFAHKIANYQTDSKIPLLIGIDQEGGQVSRLTHSGLVKQNGDQFKFPREQYQNAEDSSTGSGMKAAVNYAKKNATLLHQLGINWNFAPDADYSDDPESFIYQRGFGGVKGKKSYKAVADYIKQVVPAWQHDHYVAATLKHFPGYGDAADTHTGFAHVTKSKAAILKQDALPFKVGINKGADAVMVTHVIYDKIDPKYPASLSKKMNTLLRKNCHFNGVVVTDAMEMGAIQNFAKKHHVNADVLAVKAGNDMIMSANYRSGIAAIAKAVKKKQISESQINASVKRILTMKNKLHLLSAADLKVKPDKRSFFSLKSVKYHNGQATIAGQAKKNAKITLRDNSNNQVVKSVKADRKGKFTLTLAQKPQVQSYFLTSPDFVGVNLAVKAKTGNSVDSFLLDSVSYNKKHTQATISGQVPDSGAEGSLTVNYLDANTGKKITSAVVGKDGKFSAQVPLTKSSQNIDVAISGYRDLLVVLQSK